MASAGDKVDRVVSLVIRFGVAVILPLWGLIMLVLGIEFVMPWWIATGVVVGVIGVVLLAGSPLADLVMKGR